MIPLLFLLLQAAPPQAVSTPPIHEHSPVPVQCETNTAETCIAITMKVDGSTRSFTAQDFGGKDPKAIDEFSVCHGRMSKGSIRYFANGTAPSSLVGTVVPAVDPEVEDPNGTLEPDNLINLYNRELITKFKSTQANWGGAEIVWECKL